MKIVVIGTRGIPNIQGGVETHCQQLYPRIAAMGHDVTVIRRSCYVSDNNKADNYRNVKLIDLYAPRIKSVEAIVHTFLAAIKARLLNADIVHIHADGPALMAPLCRILGMKVVMTNHGPEYNRSKWGSLAKCVLKTGEWLGTKFSNQVIVIARFINDILVEKYHRTDANLIFNGVETPTKSTSTQYINQLGLQPKKYVLAVGRFVKEKAFHDLIEAFANSGLSNDYKLVLAGDADHEDDYSQQLKQLAAQHGVVLTGFIRGEKLNQIYTHAALFCLPSYHEGLPISLLEAMSYNLDVAVSNIEANKLSCLSNNDFFETGNTWQLSQLLQTKLTNPCLNRTYDLSLYNWDNIACQVVDVYKKALGE
ncbi:MAG: glycosyltransferase family 4 protein [Muribaculaceae bacterium]